MRLELTYDSTDVEIVKKLAATPESRKLIRERNAYLAMGRTRHDDAAIWRAMVVCLLTKRQRATPGTAVQRFCDETPFQLAYGVFAGVAPDHIGEQTTSIIARNGLWRANEIGPQVQENAIWLGDGGFDEIRDHIDRLAYRPNSTDERATATFLAEKLKGIGPEQSRNFLLNTGVMFYEIPIDSRVTRWIKTNLSGAKDLPISDKTLADPDYYTLILDCLVQLAHDAGLTPVEFDAIMFGATTE